MAARRVSRLVAQAWIELKADDPEAVSALAVARANLPVGPSLRGLRRLRLVEIAGKLPARAKIEDLLHQSTQFYNPHKERCAVRLAVDEPAPLRAGERAVLVVEREDARRSAAERWWRHETGEVVEVREGAAWAVTFDDGGADALMDLALVRGRRHGLLCNPHSQDCRVAGGTVPLPWLGEAPPSVPRRRARPRATRSRE